MYAGRTIATFRTAREVIKGDTACRKEGIPVRVMAVPESISSECGMCLEVEAEEGGRARFLELMKLQNIPVHLYDTPSV